MKNQWLSLNQMFLLLCFIGVSLGMPAYALTPTAPDIVVPNIGNQTVSRIINVDGSDYYRLGSDIPAGGEPAYISVGDFNNDGLKDLVVVNPSPGELVFMLGKPNGAFDRLSQVISFGFQISAVAVGDFNNDGLHDLLVSFNGSSVQVWLAKKGSILTNNPNDHFVAQTPMPIANRANAVAVADFNNDGKLDAVVCDYNANKIFVLMGNGDGVLTPQLTLDAGSRPEDVRIGDFNADGNADFAVAGGLSQYVSAYLGNGNGTFAPEIQLTTRFGGDGTYSLAVGDLNNDGYDDIITRGGSSASGPTLDVILWNPVSGSFDQSIPPIPTQNVFLVGITAVDMNADGNLDVVFPNSPSENKVTIYFGNGAGHLASPKTIDTGANPNGIAVIDINPVLNDYAETIRFHKRPDGSGHINAFSSKDTLYVTVNDVKVSSTIEPTVADVTLIQKGKIVNTAKLKARPDGSYVASMKLAGIGLGEARVKVQLTFSNDVNEAFYNLIRNSKIMINNVVVTFEQFAQGQMIGQNRGVFPDLKIDYFSDRGISQKLTAQLDPLMPRNMVAQGGFSDSPGSDVVNVYFTRADVDTSSIKVHFKVITDDFGKSALVFDNLSYNFKNNSDSTNSSLYFGLMQPPLGGPAVLFGPDIVQNP